MNLFKKKKYVPIVVQPSSERVKRSPVIPDGAWIKCGGCRKTVYQKGLDTFRVCPHCGYHFRLSAPERIAMVCDENGWEEFDASMRAQNPLQYPNYEQKVSKTAQSTGIQDAVVTGLGKINGIPAVVGVMDSRFIMGSMGSVVGEKITRVFEYALKSQLPVVLFTASGGARMQEGIVSLMQMAKISAAVGKHSEAGLLYISVLTDPTTGGVTASFATLADIILTEPGALIGFAGRRVIEQTLKQKLPAEFQTAEFQLEHGFVDKIIHRSQMKSTLAHILRLHKKEGV